MNHQELRDPRQPRPQVPCTQHHWLLSVAELQLAFLVLGHNQLSTMRLTRAFEMTRVHALQLRHSTVARVQCPQAGLCGSVALWLCGSVALWLCGSVALWLCGSVALWLYGSVALCASLASYRSKRGRESWSRNRRRAKCTQGPFAFNVCLARTVLPCPSTGRHVFHPLFCRTAIMCLQIRDRCPTPRTAPSDTGTRPRPRHQRRRGVPGLRSASSLLQSSVRMNPHINGRGLPTRILSTFKSIRVRAARSFPFATPERISRSEHETRGFSKRNHHGLVMRCRRAFCFRAILGIRNRKV
jgi:hypothetical protein